jgi:hypothetical protein
MNIEALSGLNVPSSKETETASDGEPQKSNDKIGS